MEYFKCLGCGKIYAEYEVDMMDDKCECGNDTWGKPTEDEIKKLFEMTCKRTMENGGKTKELACPCEACFYYFGCDHVLDENCPDDIKKDFPEIWDESGNLIEESEHGVNEIDCCEDVELNELLIREILQFASYKMQWEKFKLSKK